MELCQNSPISPAAHRQKHHRTLPARLMDWVVEARSHRVICLVVGIWLLNAFDLAFTLLSHEQGLLHEQNPLARRMLDNGTASVVLYKVGLVLIGTYPLIKFRSMRIAELASLVIILTYATLAIRWSTCYDLYVAAFHNNVIRPTVIHSPTAAAP